MPRAAPKSVSAIIALRRARDVVAPQLASLAHAGIEVVVVDDRGLDDGLPPAGVRLIRHPERLCLAGALNLGAAASGGELLVFLDADVSLDESGLAALDAAAAAAPPEVPGFAADARWLATAHSPALQRFLMQATRPGELWTVDGELAALRRPAFACRRDAFMAVGGFDERAPDEALDLDLSGRLHAAGLRMRGVAGWRVSLPPPATRPEAGAWLEVRRAAFADQAARRGDAVARAWADGGFGAIPRSEHAASWRRALRQAEAKHAAAIRASQAAARGELTVETLAWSAARTHAHAPNLRAPLSWPSHGGPKLSIVIPSYNRADHLSRLLPRLAPQAREAGAEIIIVDDGSADRRYAEIVRPFADVAVLHRMERNTGRGAATRIGVELASGDWIVFTDDDVWPPQDWLATLASLLTRFPELEAAGGTCRPQARLRRGLVEAFTLTRPNFVPRPYFGRGSMKCMITACMAVRADVLAKVGGIDVNFSSGQDHNLTWRLRRSGARMHMTGEWWVGHDQAWPLADLCKRMHAYAYWHVRQADLSGEAIDYLTGPEEDWRGFLGKAPAQLRWVVAQETASNRSALRKLAYMGLDMLSFAAWNLGGIAGARALKRGARAA
ncbi:MAG: glycosyltransferase family 2 protein [Caulobacterales bacterium]